MAYLLLNANQLIPAEQLIDAIWGGSPPLSARGQVQVCVSHIRNAIRALGAEGILSSQDGGYRLTVNDDELDLARFLTKVTQGRAAIRDDADAAADVLRSGLALWRGPALSGAAGAFVEPTAAGLHEQRLAAFEDLAEADLALGRHTRVAADLRPLVDAHPFRERLVGQLMLALAGCGQQVQALQLYSATRSALSDQLGLEPGPGLADVHLRILRQQMPAPRVAPVAATTPDLPRQLPLDTPCFTGRAAEALDISQLLEPGGVAVLFGPGGIGKSALAVHIAHGLAERFGGQLYVNLRGATPGMAPLRPVDVLEQFLRSLGSSHLLAPGASSLDELAARFRSATAGKRILILLDDAADFTQIRYLIPGASTCAVLITSRQQLTGFAGVHHHRLRPLPNDDAIRLLARLAGTRISADPAVAEELVHLCDSSPLALSIAAARLNARPTWNAARLVSRLKDQCRRLDELADGDRAVRATFSVSYQDLLRQSNGGDAARMFRLTGLLDVADFGVPAAAAVAEHPEDRAEELLDVLVDAQLLENDTPGRYRLHDLLRLLASERANAEEPASRLAAAQRRVFHHYLASARNASRAIRPMSRLFLDVEPRLLDHAGTSIRTHVDAVDWIESEHGNLAALVRQAASSPAIGPAIAVALTTALLQPLGYAGRGRDQEVLSEVACTAASKTGDPEHLAAAAFIRGGVLHNLRPAEAAGQLLTARRVWRELGNKAGEAVASTHLGTTYGAMGRFDDSVACLEAARKLFQEAENAEGEASCLDHLGIAYRRIGRGHAAITAHEASIRLCRKLGLQAAELISTANLATTIHSFGDLDQAITRYEQVLRLARTCGHRQVEAECLWGIAQAYVELGNIPHGRRNRQEAAQILYDLGWITADEQHQISTQHNPPIPRGFWTNV